MPARLVHREHPAGVPGDHPHGLGVSPAPTSRLTRLLGLGQQLPSETLDVLGKLHVLDDRGQAFRYSAVKTGLRSARVLERARPGQQHFDIVAVAEALREAGTMVLDGVFRGIW